MPAQKSEKVALKALITPLTREMQRKLKDENQGYARPLPSQATEGLDRNYTERLLRQVLALQDHQEVRPVLLNDRVANHQIERRRSLNLVAIVSLQRRAQ